MQSKSILALTILASTAITSRRFVTATGAVAEAGGPALGVARANAVTGEAFPVDCLGTGVVTSGGAFAYGVELEVGADGQAVARDQGVAVARALQAATAAGQDVEVFLIPNAAQPDTGGD